jgi:hypothetical protein
MSQIDKIVTEANLRDVRVIDFDVMVDGVGIDINNYRKMAKRYGIENSKDLAVLLNKDEQLRQLAREWTEMAKLEYYKGVRIVILIEQEQPE